MGGTRQKQESNTGGGWRFSATPATRTLKISAFYPKNRQKSQTLLRLGSRYTSDDSPTVTQIYLSYLVSRFRFCLSKTKAKMLRLNPRESSRFATPAIRTLKISVFYPKNSQKSQILLLVGSRHTSDDSPTVTQTSLYFTFLLWLYDHRTYDPSKEVKSTGEFPLCNARHKDIKNKRILPQK